MKAKLVKFDEDGTICKNDINFLRRHPECGIPFIQDKPFEPINPKHKFRPQDRNFNIDVLDRAIPSDPDILPAPPIGQPTLQATAIEGTPYTNQYLPQDYTNKYDLGGKRILAETPHGHSVDEYVTNKIVNYFNKSGYGIVPRIGNDSYSHQEPKQRIMTDEEMIEFQIKKIKQKTTLPKPRRPLPEIPGSELIALDPEVEEALVTQQAERFVRKGRPEISKREAEQIADFFIQKNIFRERTMEILKKYNLYDEEFELNLEKIPDPNERAAIRKLRAMRIIREQEQKLGIRRVGEIELEDFGAGVGIPNQAPVSRDDILPPSVELEDRPATLRTTRIRPVADPRDTEFVLKPRGMTDDEVIDTQIQQLTRNSTQEEAKLIESQIKAQKRRITLPKRKVPVPDIEGTELVAIEPEKEEILITREAERFVREGRPQISQREAEQIAEKFLEKGISRSRTLQILEEYGLYDAQAEFELQAIADPKERAMIRRMRAQRIIEAQQRDTNLLPERQASIELREDTPLTDIAPDRSRVEKVMDRTAGKLQEELRTLVGSVKRNAQEFNENIRTNTNEAIVNIKARTTRIFAQRYSNIRGGDIELLAPEGNINIRTPATEDITGIRAGDLQAVDFNPLGADYQETFIGGERPKLTYAERIQTARAGTFVAETAVAGAGAVGGVLIGFGVAELMGKAGVDNKYAIAAGAGGAGGAGARILTMAGSRALTRSVGGAVAETGIYSAIRGGTSILRGAAEGAVVGLALMPVDMLLNEAFVNSGMSHTGANLASGAIVGTTATALTTIGLASLGASSATLGASLVVGALAMATAGVIGLVTGKNQDEDEKKALKNVEQARQKLNTMSNARERLLISLPRFNYNFEDALNAFPSKGELGMDDDTWSSFSSSVGNMFKPRPTNSPLPVSPSSEPPTEEEKKINDLFNQFVTRRLIYKVCSGGTGCEELRRHDKGELTNEEYEFLEEKTGGTWRNQANMQVEMSRQELNYTRKRIGDAQMEMLNAWNNEQKVANQLDPYIVQTASLDPTFRQRYDLAIKLDAQQRVVDAYQTDQTRIEQLPKNVRDTANLDPEFNSMIHKYYESIETTAGQLDISVPQLIELQGLQGEAQKDKYEEFQFNNIKQNQTIVSEAKEIAKEEDQVREAGFYDIDQAFLETDPTAIHTWHPTDSQILQAHSAGMTLNEYVNYMHELSKGEAGDFTKLPKYNEEQLRASGLLDYSHFQDELQVAGYRKDLYLYDPDTRQFTLNPNITNSAIPSTQENFISRYTPKYLLQARQEYADMIHGLNQSNQTQVDNYNNNLMKELSSYGKHYDSIVADINNERLYEGRSDLLFYDVGKIYNQNKVEFSPLSDKLSDAPTNVASQDVAMGRQLGEQVSIKEKYTLDDTQYRNVKLDLQSKNIKDPSQEQLETAVQEVKSSPLDAPPVAS